MVYHYVFLYLSGWTEIFDGRVTFLPTVYYCQLVGMMDGTDIHLVSYLLPVHKIRFHLIVVGGVQAKPRPKFPTFSLRCTEFISLQHTL